MRVYLDTCSLHRPLDNRAQVRVALEAEAVLAVLSLYEAGTLALVSSDVLAFETERSPHPQRKAFVSAILETVPERIALTDSITRRAKVLEQRGFGALDALHLASAEAAFVDVFCTCDDRLLRKARAQPDLAVRVLSPLPLAQELLAGTDAVDTESNSP